MNLDLSTLNDPGTSPHEARPPLVLKTEFPHVIDNTAREQFFTCARKFQLSTINKIQPDPKSIHLHAGGAYAAGLEELRKQFYDNGLSEDDALDLAIVRCVEFYGDFEPPEGSHKTCERIVGAIIDYVREYPLTTDIIRPYRYASGKHAIEFTFAVPLPFHHPVTGDPLLYAGRFDMLAVRDGVLFVEDDKTTSQLGPTWTRQWELNSQFTGYVWAAKQYDLPVAGAIIRGQSILAKSYGHAQAILFRPQWMIDRWYTQLLRDIERMVAAWKSDTYDYALGSACTAYGGCEFAKLCASQHPEPWIQTHYIQKHWNPLLKDPEEVEPEPLASVEQRLIAQGYDLEALEKDNPYTQGLVP